ncbi:phosphoglucomutase/phosphomannomutase [Enterococcus sulfureus ATCC 49903]|uniref:Phosphoglucomutase/phosphomannomutase n=1 Tax=Enterococcus sulfureus ATCC 49903 TaxID=1140003 RepID=S0L7U8_9ENTE|nr:phosphoglucomutase/phosphomannomutase [Enterococcus sulfureus]EOT49510.1 phosphoglucomutase/phosphomannomutase [Enterococcus sulfureus ATCC 49903]EOT87377.1 phosphoglucomutase/phosphomannomutase [Enterococcus sulfureus ATCC 49903]
MGTLASLQNGSDIRGIAIETDEHQANLTPEAVEKIAYGVTSWLMSQKGYQHPLTIGIGRDSRLSGPILVQHFIKALRAQGVQVIDFELATTPAMFMATQFEAFNCDAGIMFTASHLPYYFNEIKIFSRDGGAEKEDIRFILEHSHLSETKENGELLKADILTPYAADLVKKIKAGMKTDQEQPLKNWHIIVDAGNGAGGFFAKHVLEVLGANTDGSQFLEPDGAFPNHIPNPDNKEAMASIQKAVLAHQADLGVIFDTDVDRSAVVTKSGEVMNRNNLIAVLSQIVLHEYPGTSIVTNSPTSDHVKVFIESLGGKQVRYISGYRNVINKAIALNNEGIDSQLAIETSGHAAFKENYFLDDGAYVIAKILMLLPQLAKEEKSLDELMADLKQPAETKEIRFLIKEDARVNGQQVIDSFKTFLPSGFTLDPENEEGIRMKISEPYGSGWYLLRLSLHEPLLVLQIENDEPGHLKAIAAAIAQQIAHFPVVDQTNMKAFLAE